MTNLAIKPRGRPRDEVARGRILDAALEVLEDVGFSETTCDAIADRAGASKATIYRWWPNKAAVLIEALREAVAQELPFPDTGCLRKDVRLQLRNFVKLLNGRRGRAFKIFISASQNDAEVADAFRTVWIQPRRGQTRAFLERHREMGRLPADTDLDLTMDLLYGPLYYRLLTGHGQLTAEYADAIAEVVLRGLAAPEPAE